MFKIPHLLLMITPLFFCIAQNSKEVDSTRIVSYADKFVVKINVDTQTDIYTVRNNQNGSELIIVPNNNYRVFLSLDYEFLGVSIGFSPTFFPGNNDDDFRGESSFSDFKFRAVLGQWIQGFQMSTIKGYYVENSGDFLPGWTEGLDPYLQIPDLTSKTFGMSTSYSFNPNFSFRNILYQTEWQKKSAGSFIPALFYSYDRLSYSLGDEQLKEDAFPIRLSLAYFYTAVIEENWFISWNLAPSLGVRFANSTLESNDMISTENNTATSYSLEGGFQVGYASKKIIFGSGFSFNFNGYNEDELNTIGNDKAYGLVYFGYRLDAPGFISKTYDKLAEKIGLE